VAKHALDLVGQLQEDLDFDLVDDGVLVSSSSVFVAHQNAAPFESGSFPYCPVRPMLIVFQPHRQGDKGPYHPDADAVAEVIGPLLPADCPVLAFGADGVIEGPVEDLSRITWLVAAYVPGVDPLEVATDPRAMQYIVARLRRPDGCPWDRKQTHQSLRGAIIEETYEIVDAIDSGDMAHLAEELGDMFLLILMHAQIAHEAGDFSIEDVYRGIASKIVGRHPHVFGDAVANTDADLSRIWIEAKAREKSESGKGHDKDFDGEPYSMPALTRASRVLSKYPVAADDNTPSLLRTVAEVIAAGDDPDSLLKQQLRDHVANHP